MSTHSLPPPPQPPPQKPHAGGRPVKNLDQHKDLVLDLYAKKTPWHKIEQILLVEHGIQMTGRTIMRRFKEWNVGFRRVQTDKNESLKTRVRELWADRANRPKNDDELYHMLKSDGFKVSRGAIPALRVELNLYRRWDEKLGRVRPDSELGNRGRRKQKYSAFTSAQLALIPLPGEGEGDSSLFQTQSMGIESQYAPLGSPPEDMDSENGQSEMDQLEYDPSKPVRRFQNAPSAPVLGVQAPPPTTVPKKRGRPLKQIGPEGNVNGPADPASKTTRKTIQDPLTILYARKNAQVRELQDRVRLLEQHCQAHGIGLPEDPNAPTPDLHGVQSLPAAADVGTWENNPGFEAV